eukprot:m.287043 g.287043  ORF g.287043 m.287043 type:complete len:307 (+) comp15787_c0_seq1:752-1672(+)
MRSSTIFLALALGVLLLASAVDADRRRRRKSSSGSGKLAAPAGACVGCSTKCKVDYLQAACTPAVAATDPTCWYCYVNDGPAPPAGACDGCAGECEVNKRQAGCTFTSAATDPACWKCDGEDEHENEHENEHDEDGHEDHNDEHKGDLVPPAGACGCGSWVTECHADLVTCTYVQASTDATCWVCQAAPADACAHSCDPAVDECEFAKGCGDPANPACYYCEAGIKDVVPAPADACADCGGPATPSCQPLTSCNKLQRYLDPTCWSCPVPTIASVAPQVQQAVQTTTRARQVYQNRESKRGRRRRR